MHITTSVGITAVLALTIACAPAQVPPPEASSAAAPAAPAAPAAAGAPDRAAVLAQYVGDYNINGSTMTIRARGDALVREMPGQPDQVLRPIGRSATRFTVGTTQAELHFQPDASGGMTLIMRAGQHEARGSRVRRP